MFDAAETVGKSLRILQGVVSTLKVRRLCLADSSGLVSIESACEELVVQKN